MLFYPYLKQQSGTPRAGNISLITDLKYSDYYLNSALLSESYKYGWRRP